MMPAPKALRAPSAVGWVSVKGDRKGGGNG
jgi:hypothetical protein